VAYFLTRGPDGGLGALDSSVVRLRGGLARLAGNLGHLRPHIKHGILCWVTRLSYVTPQAPLRAADDYRLGHPREAWTSMRLTFTQHTAEAKHV